MARGRIVSPSRGRARAGSGSGRRTLLLLHVVDPRRADYRRSNVCGLQSPSASGCSAFVGAKRDLATSGARRRTCSEDRQSLPDAEDDAEECKEGEHRVSEAGWDVGVGGKGGVTSCGSVGSVKHTPEGVRDACAPSGAASEWLGGGQGSAGAGLAASGVLRGRRPRDIPRRGDTTFSSRSRRPEHSTSGTAACVIDRQTKENIRRGGMEGRNTKDLQPRDGDERTLRCASTSRPTQTPPRRRQ